MKFIKVISIANILLFFLVVCVNALANILPINNYNTGELSDLIPNLFVPSGITFSIWGVIYTLLLILVFSNLILAFKNSVMASLKFNIYLIINFILNTSWILAWHYRFVGISLLIMLGIFFTLLKLNNEIAVLQGHKFKRLACITIGVYFGWISVATIANTTALLVTLGWNGFPLTEEFWTIAVILVGAVIAILKLLFSRDFAFSIVFIWAYYGIILKRYNSVPVYNSIIGVSIFSIAVIFVIILFKLINNKKIAK